MLGAKETEKYICNFQITIYKLEFHSLPSIVLETMWTANLQSAGILVFSLSCLYFLNIYICIYNIYIVDIYL